MGGRLSCNCQQLSPLNIFILFRLIRCHTYAHTWFIFLTELILVAFVLKLTDIS